MKFCYPVNIINIRQEKSSLHLGVDFGFDSGLDKNSYNQNIINPFKGEVTYIKYQSTGGYVVHIYSKELNLTSEFGHLKKGSIKVKLHQVVNTGEVIAKMGNSGKVTGYHLHYGLYKGKLNYNKKANFLNPLNYLVRYPKQIVSDKSKFKLKIINAKIVHGIEDEPLLVHNKKSFSKASIVKGYNLYNGDIVPVYEVDGKFALIDKVRGYYTSKNYLWQLEKEALELMEKKTFYFL